jgi:hypothetical protein
MYFDASLLVRAFFLGGFTFAADAFTGGQIAGRFASKNFTKVARAKLF